jgi:hypothetical protein
MTNETFVERHIITALIMLVVALVSWVGVTVVQSGRDIDSKLAKRYRIYAREYFRNESKTCKYGRAVNFRAV